MAISPVFNARAAFPLSTAASGQAAPAQSKFAQALTGGRNVPLAPRQVRDLFPVSSQEANHRQVREFRRCVKSVQADGAPVPQRQAEAVAVAEKRFDGAKNVGERLSAFNAFGRAVQTFERTSGVSSGSLIADAWRGLVNGKSS
jgi:hypothetical protein